MAADPSTLGASPGYNFYIGRGADIRPFIKVGFNPRLFNRAWKTQEP